MDVHDPLPLDELRRPAKAITERRVWFRSQAVILASQGSTADGTSHALGCGPRAVQTWVAKFNQGSPQPLNEWPHHGRPPRRTGPQLLRLEERPEVGPEPEDGVGSSHGRDLQRILRREFGVLLSLRAVFDLRHKLGFSSLRPGPQHIPTRRSGSGSRTRSASASTGR